MLYTELWRQSKYSKFCLVVFKKIMYNKQLFEYNLNVYNMEYKTK